MSNAMVGGWSNFNFTITGEATAVFNTALKGFVGVKYTPLAFATQVVAGTNYCFLCEATAVYPGAPQSAAKVYIFQPLPGQGDAHISAITQVTP